MFDQVLKIDCPPERSICEFIFLDSARLFATFILSGKKVFKARLLSVLSAALKLVVLDLTILHTFGKDDLVDLELLLDERFQVWR